MNYDPKIHHRRSIRLNDYDYTTPGGYFITIVTQGRKSLFGDIINGEMHYSAKGLIAFECWRAIPAHFPNAELGAFVIMPDHVHGILILHEPEAISSPGTGTIYRAPTDCAHTNRAPTPTEQFQKPVAGSIPTIVRTYKAAVTRKLVAQFGGPSNLWQRNYYEHVIRNDDDHKRIHLYIESNPLHWITDVENPEITK